MTLDRKELLFKLPFKVLSAMLQLKLLNCEYDWLFEFVLDFINLKVGASQTRELLSFLPFEHVSIRLLCSALTKLKYSFLLKDPSFLNFMRSKMFVERSQSFFSEATRMTPDQEYDYGDNIHFICRTFCLLLDIKLSGGNEYSSEFK